MGSDLPTEMVTSPGEQTLHSLEMSVFCTKSSKVFDSYSSVNARDFCD